MRTIRRKLTQRAGASIAIAMVFFLLCILVCSVILTAATAGAGRFRDLRAEEQAYLTASSAATLLCDALEGYHFEAGRSTLLRGAGAELVSATYSEGEAGLAEWLRLSAQTVYDQGLPATQEVEIAVEGLETAYAALAMETNYDVRAVVYLKTEDGGQKNAIVLHLPAVVEAESRSEAPGGTQAELAEREARLRHEVTQVSWPEGTFQRGGVQ